MKQKTRIIDKEVDYLKNAQPQFVSLVDHGANQTPFAIIKSLKGEKKMSKKKKKLRLVRKGAKLAGVRKLTFDKSKFPNEAAVTKYLDSNNWIDYTITDAKSFFEVSAEGITDATFKSIREVEVEEGVKGFVGEVTKEAAEGEGVEIVDENADAVDDGKDDTTGNAYGGEDVANEGDADTQKSEKKSEVAHVCKFDYWAAMLSGETSVEGVMKDGMSDGVPPGFNEVINSVYTAVSNIFTSDKSLKDKKNLVKQAGEEFANVTNTIYEVYAKLLETETKTENQTKFVESIKSFVEKHATTDTTSKSAEKTEADKKLDVIIKALGDLTSKVVSTEEAVKKATELATTANTELSLLKSKSPARKSQTVDSNEEFIAKQAEDALAKKKLEEEIAKDIAFENRGRLNVLGMR